MTDLLRSPPFDLTSERRYRLEPRAKPTFKSIVPVRELITDDPARASVARMRPHDEEGGWIFEFEFPLATGVIEDVLELVPGAGGGGLRTSRLCRIVRDSEGAEIRREEADFLSRAIPLPAATYPEVALPFLLSFQPMDGEVRDLFSWINDRFLARVDFRSTGKERIDLPGVTGKVRAIKAIMYPDFNDWVPLPKVLSKLAVPFVPKYHMWFAAEPPHEVLRFEGPYGPPGAPEVTMTLLAEEG